MARIAIVGPGAVGGVLAALLHQGGRHELVLCARRQLAELVVETISGPVRFAPRVVTDPANAPAVDWVFVTTKAYDAPAAAAWLPRLMAEGAPVAIIQNGVEHRERFADKVPMDRLVPVMVDCPAERSGRDAAKESGARSQESGDGSQGMRIQNSESRIQNSGVRAQAGDGNRKTELGGQEPEGGSQGTRIQNPESRIQNSGMGAQEAGDGGQTRGARAESSGASGLTKIVQRGAARLVVQDDERGRAFVELWQGTTAQASVTADLKSALWRKLCVNAAGVVSALVDQPAGVMRDDDAAELGRSLIREVIAVGRAEGAVLSDETVEAVIDGYRKAPVDGINSLHADVRAGRPSEIDARNGVVVRFGRKHGIAAPYNEMAVRLVRCMRR